ncbi:MAG: pirin family protein, partial [Cryomorphaceae bacterium]
MANNKLLIDERQADIGNFMVGRLLPFRKKRQVGPFTFIDHMGPARMGNGTYTDVDQHPHIGLS